MDNDRVATVRDIALIAGHFNGTVALTEAQKQIADVNRDGAVNDADMDELVKEILGTRTPETLPLSKIRFTSPLSGEANVAVTRETVVHFTVPLSLSAALDTTKFQAEFGGKEILSRVEISSDRKKATLFYLEPLPSNARIRGRLDTAGLADLINRPVDGDGDGVAGGVYNFSFDTLSITPIGGTAMVGRVIASERGTGGVETPLAGVTITVDGAEETLRAVTDAQGNFTLTPCPAGTFFVKIDGRTSPRSSWPSGDYYPFVGKKWHALAGRTDNLAGDEGDRTRGTIYLPCVCSGSLKTASTTQDTSIPFPTATLEANPALAGTSLLVPANSLFSDDGTRGGRVGIAPVAPDRLPSPLPEGLNPTLVVTIQTDGGTNFDRPVPVVFPNLPDPLTGEVLPAGATSALWSFNHDTGEWEISGPMTVTEDGKFLQSDPGTGVRQPGWHVPAPGTGGRGGEEDPPDPPEEPLELSVESTPRNQPGPGEDPIVQEGDSPLVIGSNQKGGVEWDVSAPPGSVTTSPGGNKISITPTGGSESIGDIVITGTYVGKDETTTDTIRITVVPKLQIAVDKDRDGFVSFGDEDKTSASSPHVFWANTDNDNDAIRLKTDLVKGDLGSKSPFHWPDVQDTPSNIDGLADLEDFDRLVVKGEKIYAQLLRSGYSFRVVQTGQKIPTKSIGVIMSDKEPQGLEYITDASFAGRQLIRVIEPNSDIIHSSPGTRVLEANRFNSDQVTFLFEGRGLGKQKIKVELVKPISGNTSPNATAESNIVHLDIRHIERFYDIYSPKNTSGGNCHNTATPYHQISEQFIKINTREDWSLMKEDKHILVVHGWNTTPQDRQLMAETTFKRLFWLGYRGKVSLFSWPSDIAPDVAYFIPGPVLNPKNYDRSERRSWNSAAALYNVFVDLKSKYQHTAVLAHSLGNIAVCEALRKAALTNNKIVDTYIATQSAVSAGFFATAAPKFGVNEIRKNEFRGLGSLPSRDDSQPDIYGEFPSVGGYPYFADIPNGFNRMINLYNPSDYALDFWMVNQLTKPDRFDGIDVIYTWGGQWKYDDSNWFHREINNKKLIGIIGQGQPMYKDDVPIIETLSPIQNRYEIFSHIAQSRYRALGQANINSPSQSIKSLNLSSAINPVFGFGEKEFDHSGQINRPLVYSQYYWQKLVIDQLGF